MNHRIRELERQATETVRCGLNGTSTAESFNRKKFAELIVRECLFKIETEAAQYAEPVWAFELVNDIKEHFGVNE